MTMTFFSSSGQFVSKPKQGDMKSSDSTEKIVADEYSVSIIKILKGTKHTWWI